MECEAEPSHTSSFEQLWLKILVFHSKQKEAVPALWTNLQPLISRHILLPYIHTFPFSSHIAHRIDIIVAFPV